MAYTVGQSGVANYVNTTLTTVTRVIADGGMGGSGEVAIGGNGRATVNFTISVNTANAFVNVSSLDGYIAGKTDVIVTVQTGVYAYGVLPTAQNYPLSPPPGTGNVIGGPLPGLEIAGGVTGDTIKLINNGYITGYGGDGSGLVEQTSVCCCSGYYAYTNQAQNGGPALSFVTPGITLLIENNGFIAGGGGGGGSAINDGSGVGYSGGVLGGGGAGGGVCYSPLYTTPNRATPASPAGLNGVRLAGGYDCVSVYFYTGGGGGFTFPGVGGSLGTVAPYNVVAGVGGGAGGSGAMWNAGNPISATPTNAGGSGNNNAQNPSDAASGLQYVAGGGGGWGANGGSGSYRGSFSSAGAVGGNSILTNGNSYTLTGSGSLWGSVDTTLRSLVYTFASSAQNTVLNFDTISGFSSSNNAQVVLVVPANVNLYSTTNTSPALTIGYSLTNRNCNVRMILNGNIYGAGGTGGGENTTPVNGGTALQVGSVSLGNTFSMMIDNTVGYIAGGGGGGGYTTNNATYSSATRVMYGGGGAGGGASGGASDFAYNSKVTSLNTLGNNGTTVVNGSKTYVSGGTGGTVLPGTRTTRTGTITGPVPGIGGQAGGTGATDRNTSAYGANGNYGGAFQEGGGSVNLSGYNFAGGGGGWGIAGGDGYRGTVFVQLGSNGGLAVSLSAYQTPGNLFITTYQHTGGYVAAV